MNQLYKDNKKFIILETILFVLLFSHYNNQIPSRENFTIFVCTGMVCFLLIGLFYICLKKCKDIVSSNVKMLALVFTFFAAPMFWTANNFGSIHIYGLIFVLLGVYLIVWSKMEWLLVPISFLTGCIDVEIMLLYVNVIYVLLLYKIFYSEGKERGKYITIFCICIFIGAILLLKYSYSGQLLQRIIGESINWNLGQVPVFLLVMFPYCGIVVVLFISMIRNAKQHRIIYFLMFIGGFSILPSLFMQQNYGRWMFAVIFYYAIILLALFALNDVELEEEFHKISEKICSIPGAVLLLGYPIIFQPLEWIATGLLFENLKNITF